MEGNARPRFTPKQKAEDAAEAASAAVLRIAIGSAQREHGRCDSSQWLRAPIIHDPLGILVPFR